MTTLALVLALLFAFVAFGVRTIVQLRRTGDSGWRMGGPKTPATVFSHVSLAAAPMVLLVGLVLAATDAAWAMATTVPTVVGIVGAVAAGAGVALTFLAQLDMGTSWRVGVDAGERTALVTGGLYRWVRNPIYTGIASFLVGEALLVPGWWTAAAAVLAIAGMQVQTRLVEEPHLIAVHGAAYRSWARRTGRFLPGIGTLAAEVVSDAGGAGR